MSQHHTGPEASDQRQPEGVISLTAIIVAGLASATAAVIRPYFDFGPNEAILGATFTSMVITTSSAIYKCCLERGRRWRSFLLVGILAGLVACFLGIGSVSAAELAAGRTPSITEEGEKLIAFTPPPSPPPPPPPPPPPHCGANGLDDDLDGLVAEPNEECVPTKLSKK